MDSKMPAEPSSSDARPRKPPWYAPTVGRYLWATLLLQVGLYLSQHFGWFWFNEHKGYTVLIAVGATLILFTLLLAWFVFDLFFGAKSRFSLATLMLIVPVVGIPFGWLAHEMDQARQQRETLMNFRSRGALTLAQYDYESTTEWAPSFLPSSALDRIVLVLGTDFFTSVVNLKVLVMEDRDLEKIGRFTKLRRLDIRSTLITDAGLEHLKDLNDLEQLLLYRACDITDDGLEHIAGLARLRMLHLDGATQVTDEGIERLNGLVGLQELGLSYTAVSDPTLQRIARFPHLESLDLEATRVTSADLAELESLAKLQELGLSHTLVTDEGLAHLEKLPYLRRITLRRCRVTDDGVKKLKEALPQCEIVR